jgi:hypothetical protein
METTRMHDRRGSDNPTASADSSSSSVMEAEARAGRWRICSGQLGGWGRDVRMQLPGW